MANSIDVANLKQLLTLSTTAKLLNVSPSTIGRWVRDGSLPSLILHQGKRKVTRRFRQSDVARLVTPAYAADDSR